MFVVEFRFSDTDSWTDCCCSEIEAECDAYVMRRVIAGSPNLYRVLEVDRLHVMGTPKYEELEWVDNQPRINKNVRR